MEGAGGEPEICFCSLKGVEEEGEEDSLRILGPLRTSLASRVCFAFGRDCASSTL